jgi:2-polyprenyl-3-methyl-5-hydroxy-6-metoxy-1,4-benzoquinol methylase
LTRFFVAGNTVTGVDVDTVALAKARALGIETIEVDLHGDWHNLAGRTFDCVVAGEVLEHLYFPDKVMSQVAQHLKPGGVFVGSVPNAFSLKNRVRLFLGKKKYTPLGDPTHINHFLQRELEAALHKSFAEVTIYPLSKYAWLDAFFPGMFSFNLLFKAVKAASIP